MLREIKAVRQIHGEPRRRWFEDDYFDLIIWQDEGEDILGFELHFDKKASPQAVRWDKPNRFEFFSVDDGEFRADRFKMAPVLMPARKNLHVPVAYKFRVESNNIQPRISSFIFDKLKNAIVN